MCVKGMPMNARNRRRIPALLSAVLTVAAWSTYPAFAYDESTGAADIVVTSLVSPDGRRVAFGEFTGKRGRGATRLTVCSPDGSRRREVRTFTGASGRVLWYGNDQLLFTTRESGYNRVSLEGEELPPITLPSGTDVLYKRLAPNGKQVAYVGQYLSKQGEPQRGLFVVTLATGQVRQLIDKKLKTAPAWSPDSRKLAIGSAAGHTGHHQLVLVDVETGDITETGVEGVGASWSSDGRFVACTTEMVHGCFWSKGVPTDGRIGVWDVKEKTLRPVSPPGHHLYDDTNPIIIMSGSLDPVWSPDSNWIAYRHTTYAPAEHSRQYLMPNATWIVSRKGDRLRKVFDGHAKVGWTSDSRFLIYVQEGEFRRVDIHELQLVQTGGELRAPR